MGGMTAVAVILGALVPAAAGGGITFGTERNRMPDSRPVDLELTNRSGHRIELLGGSIRDRHNGELQVRLEPERRFLAPGETHTWTWIHDHEAGRFAARFRTSAGTFVDLFDLGAYFTIGFRCDDTPPSDCAAVDAFVIWVREEQPIRRLRADLEEPESQRRIVSGIVRGHKPYNPDWSYSMGSGSIVVAEVFTEVCDAHPSQVEEHRRRWMGERWCPWSSFVESEGRS